MSNYTLLSNLNREAFNKGFQSRLDKEAGFGQSLFNFADHYIKPIAKPFLGEASKDIAPVWQGMRKNYNSDPNATFGSALHSGMGNAEGQRLDAFTNQSGVEFNRLDTGALDQKNPINFGKTFSNELGRFKDWAGNQWNQAKANPMDWAKNNPWTAAGAGVLGAGALYGGYKLMNGMFGGGDNKPQQQQANNGMGQPYASPAPNTGPTVQAMPKMGAFNPLGVSPFNLPSHFAMAMVGHNQPQMPMAKEEPEPYEPQFSSDDARLRKALQNPKMQEYLINLLQHHG